MMTWLLTNSLWLIGLGLMLASSGLDGAYMAAWMPGGWEWLGYVLNTTADVSGMVLMYFFGRLQQDKTKAKRRLSVFLLASEAVTAGYSWFFGWRQLLRVLPPVEPLDYQWIAPVAAGFIPALLAFIGYAESLLAGRFDTPVVSSGAPVESAKPAPVVIEKPVASIPAPVAKPEQPVVRVDKPVVQIQPLTIDQWRAAATKMNGDRPKTVEEFNRWCDRNRYERKPATTARRWLEAV